MARIVMADDGISFDGRTPETSPLGGVESSFVMLAEILAARGHEVLCRTNCQAPLIHKGVDWAPISQGLPSWADLYVANRGDKLILAMPGARKTVFWTHNPCRYMKKWRYLWKLFWKTPDIIFIGDYHATTWPAWAPGGERIVIPYGVPDMFKTADPGDGTPPPPRAVFTSNPLRSLDWLLKVWEERIHPAVPKAELHVFSGPGTYGQVGASKAEEMKKVLDLAVALADKGVVLRGPVPKSQLVEEFRQARVMLYRGDINETFCLAVGEPQAMGVPAVVEPIGSVVERVKDGISGRVAAGQEAFAEAAIKILADDEEWRRFHQGALEHQRKWGWEEAAAAFESLLPTEGEK
jgi:glycosyltransferase involved in cell wall biosynthesis